MEKTKKELYERLNRDAAAILALSFDVGSMTEIGQSLTVIAHDILADIILLSNPETPDEHFADAGKMMSEKDDHFADPGKKGATLPDGTPINLCGGDK